MGLSRRALLAGLASTTFARPAASAGQRSLADFGARPDGADASLAIARACAALNADGGGRLVIPPGTYRVAGDSGVAFALDGLRELTIEGAGAKFLFEGLRRPFLITNSRHVTLRGLALDWARPPFSQGDVAMLSRDGRVAQIALDAVTPMDGWSTVEAICAYDRASGLLLRKRVDSYGGVQAVEAIGPRRVRIRLAHPIGLESGMTLALRHSVYEANAIECQDCSQLKIEGVTVHAAPGMAILARRCRDVTLRDCVVEPTPGSGRLMSTCADAAHVIEGSGDVLVENCRFAGMGDDGLNVHGTYWRIVAVPDRNAIVVAKRFDAAFDAQELAEAGTPFAFVSGATLEARGQGVALRSTQGATSQTIHFAGDLPPGTAVGDAVMDASRVARLTVRNCRFLGNRARGVLAHKDVLIERCEFRDMSSQAILMVPDLWWLEGPEVAHVRIVDNVFDGVDRWGEGQGAIYIDAIVAPKGAEPRSTAGFPNHDIEIARNVFRNGAEPWVVQRATRAKP